MPEGWTRSEIQSLADPGSFVRGVGYQRAGRVEIGDRHGEAVTAVVRGSMPYHVELRRSPKVAWACDCPVGDDGTFCKHCVAVALEEAGLDRTSKRPDRTNDEEPDVRKFVSGLDTEALVDLVMEQVDSDWRLRERLAAQALAHGGGSLDVRTWKRRIDSVFGDGRHFVPYAEAGGWAQDIFDVLAALDDLVSAGHAAAVVALAEHAHRRSEKAVQYIDDSDGWLTDISGRTGELHLAACREAHPDPVELAGRLAELELTSELGTFHRAAATYADVLGPDGIAAYRRIAEPKWRAAKKNKDGHGAFAVTQAMIGVALAGGDPDDLIAIRSGDLRTPDDYLEIARTLVAAGRQAESLDWSRRGLDTFVDRTGRRPRCASSSPLSSSAAGDNPAAEELWWEAFEAHPSLDGYRKLVAESADAEALRRQAVDLLRQRLDACDTRARTPNPLLERPPATTLVEILLYEGRADDAWSAASSHGCDERTWMTLARARETTHPLDAIPIYERAVAAQIDTKRNGGYRAAVDLLARIRTLATKGDQPQLFSQLLATVMAAHGRKRNLMALIDKKRWT